MIKNNFYVITGGPGGGKTSLLKELSAMGISYVPETARSIIQTRLAQGLSKRPELGEFAMQMFELDKAAFHGHTHIEKSLFFDRSFMDSAALLHKVNNKQYKTFLQFIKTHRFNPMVFITPPWKEIYVTDSERDQTFAEAVTVYRELCNWYRINNYKLVILPKISVSERAAFIISSLP